MPSHLCANFNDLVKGLVQVILDNYSYPTLEELLDRLAVMMGRKLDASELDIVTITYQSWQKWSSSR